MKKIISLVSIATILLMSNVAFGQDTNSNGGTTSNTSEGNKSAQATLNVNLYPIQTIEVSGDKTVNLDYDSKDDYLNGVEKKMDDHLTVYSTGGFAVSVKSESADLLYSKAPKDKIEASTINLSATKGSGNDLSEISFTNVALSNDYQKIISSQVGGTALKFNVAYKGNGGNDYLNKYYNVESPNVYTTTITYTIEAQ